MSTCAGMVQVSGGDWIGSGKYWAWGAARKFQPSPIPQRGYNSWGVADDCWHRKFVSNRHCCCQHLSAGFATGRADNFKVSFIVTWKCDITNLQTLHDAAESASR